MIDYEILKIIWWLLVGVLMVGFAIMDGHDMGVGIQLPFIARTDEERRVLINSIGPHWDGNQVWLLTAGGALFAAWPLIYATAFSGFYFAMMAVLWALFFRPVGFDYRSKIRNSTWRKTWDWLLFIGSVVPSLVFGVALGNVLQGVPFHFDENLYLFYTGSFWQLFNPFSIVAGVVSLMMLLSHGAIYSCIRSESPIQQRAQKVAQIAIVVMLVFFAIGGFFAMNTHGFKITSDFNPGEALYLLNKTVVIQKDGLLQNFYAYPVLWIFPIIPFLFGIIGLYLIRARHFSVAFVTSAITELGVIFTCGVALFPFILPSTTHPNSSLTLWDCVSSHLTLNIMFYVALIMTPIIVIYTSWAYHLMRGKVTVQKIKSEDHTAY